MVVWERGEFLGLQGLGYVSINRVNYIAIQKITKRTVADIYHSPQTPLSLICVILGRICISHLPLSAPSAPSSSLLRHHLCWKKG